MATIFPQEQHLKMKVMEQPYPRNIIINRISNVVLPYSIFMPVCFKLAFMREPLGVVCPLALVGRFQSTNRRVAVVLPANRRAAILVPALLVVRRCPPVRAGKVCSE